MRHQVRHINAEVRRKNAEARSNLFYFCILTSNF
jgi:hypothetical protein